MDTQHTMITAIGHPAMLEQAAEEASELSKAALKLSRIYRGENPTPMTRGDAALNLIEEYTDLVQCMEELDVTADESDVELTGTTAAALVILAESAAWLITSLITEARIEREEEHFMLKAHAKLATRNAFSNVVAAARAMELKEDRAQMEKKRERFKERMRKKGNS